MNESRTLSRALDQFNNGTDNWYRHWANKKVLYTDGAKYFFDNAGGGAMWLLDILATEPDILREAGGFAHVTLKVEGSKAKLEVTDGDKGDGPVTVFTRVLEFTTCPDGVWEFFFENNTIMLPAER